MIPNDLFKLYTDVLRAEKNVEFQQFASSAHPMLPELRKKVELLEERIQNHPQRLPPRAERDLKLSILELYTTDPELCFSCVHYLDNQYPVPSGNGTPQEYEQALQEVGNRFGKDIVCLKTRLRTHEPRLVICPHYEQESFSPVIAEMEQRRAKAWQAVKRKYQHMYLPDEQSRRFSM